MAREAIDRWIGKMVRVEFDLEGHQEDAPDFMDFFSELSFSSHEQVIYVCLRSKEVH